MEHSSDASAVLNDLRSLRRSPSERVLAGVCGGVASRLRIDPVILRVLVVVLTFFGGVGALLYAIGWLTMPVDEPGGRSLAEDALDGDITRHTRTIATALGLTIAAVAIVVTGIIGEWGHSALLALAVVGLIALLSRERLPGSAGPTPPPSPWTPPAAGVPPVGPWSTAPGVPYEMYVPPSEPAGTAPAASPLDTASTASIADQDDTVWQRTTEAPVTAPDAAAWVPPAWTAPLGDPYGPTGTGYDPGTPHYDPPPPRPRSYLGILTISVLVLVLGALGIVDSAGADLSPVTYFFAALTVIGLGLVLGTWYGRSRGLIALGIIGTLLYVPVATLDSVTDGAWSHWRSADRVRETPTSASQIRSSYSLDTGQIVLDLRDIDFTNQTVSTSIDIGAGEIRVLVPADVDLSVESHVDLGELDVLDDRMGGADRDSTISDLGSDGLGSGHLILDLTADLGHVEVTREAA